MKKGKIISRLVAATLALVLVFTQCNLVNAASSDYSSEATFTFTDAGITATNADDSSYKIEGKDLTIKESGTYVLTGSCTEGSVKVKKETTGVTLVLSDLSLASSTTAPLLINKGNTDTVIILEGTNTLTDNENPDNEDSADEEVADAFEGAALKIKHDGDLTIKGTGTLNLDSSNCKNGLKSGGEDTDAGEEGTPVTILSGTINVKADNDGVHCHSLTIKGGNITVQAGDDGIKADYDLSIGTKGSTTVPTINITKSYEGLEGATINLYSGKGTIYASDDGINAANSDLSGYTFNLNILGGTWHIDADGDGLDSNGNITVTGGVTEVLSSSENDNAAFDIGDGGSYTFTVSGGTIIGIGMSGMAVVPTSGTYVAFGASGMQGGMPGGMPGKMDSVYMDSSAEVTEETNLSAGFGQTLEPGNISIKASDEITIEDEDGDVVYTITATKTANSVILSSEDLVAGEEYTLCVNGTEIMTVEAQSGAGTNGSNNSQINPPKPSDDTTTTSDNVVSENTDGTVTVKDEVSGTNVKVTSEVTNSGLVYRMYDPTRGEHFYTKNTQEMQALVEAGWSHEDDSDFSVVSAKDDNAIPVYRLYNPNDGGMHFYTENAVEAVQLRVQGWRYEGISHYVYSTSARNGTTQYRLYNPNSSNGEHNWTTDAGEVSVLTKLGWKNEGACWKIAS